MRTARTLLAGAAVAAVLTVGTPMAFADGSFDQGKNLTWQENGGKGDDDRKGDDEGRGGDEHGRGGDEHGRGGEGRGSDEHGRGGEEGRGDKGGEGRGDKGGEGRGGGHGRPHGGVHSGGGGLAIADGGLTSSGTLASGAALLLGGIGAGAFALRRRRSSGATL